jgi:general secretion pathway protein D
MIRSKLIFCISVLSFLGLFINAQNEKAQISVQPKTAVSTAGVNEVNTAAAGIAADKEAILSKALSAARPLFGEFTVYVKRTSLNISLYISDEDRNSGAAPLVVFNKDGAGYKSLVNNNGYGTKTELNSTTSEDIDYRKLNTKIISLCKLLVDEQRFDEASLLIDRFLNEYRESVKGIKDNYKTEFESVKVYIAVLDLKEKIVNFIEDNARQSSADKKYDNAIILANAAQKININAVAQSESFKKECKTGPLGTKKLDGLIREGLRRTETLQVFEKDCKSHMDSDKFGKDTDFPAFDPERPLRKADMEMSLAQAKILIDNQEYIRARDALEKVLVRDPYNEKATKMLQIVYDNLYQAGKQRQINEMREIIAENRWNWNQAVLPTPAIKPQGNAIAVEKSVLSDKLSEIIIDQVDFEEATISSVVSLLIQRSKELDPSSTKTGVNILLRLTPEQVINIPRITMSLDGIPLGEVIRYICQACALKYRIEERAVIISSEITDIMETRFFKARAAMISSIAPTAISDDKANDIFQTGGTAATALDLSTTFAADKGGGASATAKPSLSSQALKDYFSLRGVSFSDPDAAIAYDRRGGKLVVKNTPENLRRLEALLRDLDIETPLVLIEAKFVELTQSDTEELGFEWMLNKTTNGQPSGDWTTWSSGGVIPGVTGGNGVPVPPSSSSMMGPYIPGDKIVNNLKIPGASGFPGFGRNNKLYLDVIVHAMDRSGKAEVLSAPKVIATSGQPAIIRMVRQEFYPESWTEAVVTVGDNLVQVTPSYPEFGAGTDIGITLEVTPTVSPNNYTISLNLHPQMREQIDWADYGYTITVTNTSVGGGPPMTVPATLKMPIFAVRDVTTNVKVYDGETLILGGMIRDTIEKLDDRLSGIGDVPLVGRLFRTQNERSVKQNLLIFVTARLVSPDGIPVRMGEARGLPDFRR